MKYSPPIVTSFFSSYGIPAPEYEVKFLADRKFRWDIAWPVIDGRVTKLAIEVQGGVWMKRGGHNTGVGLMRDYEKLNLATMNGWRFLLVTPQQLCTAETAGMVRELLGK